MHRSLTFVTAFAVAFAILTAGAQPAQAATCTPTGYNGLTAAIVNPTRAVRGTVAATGCDIGVYFDRGEGAVKEATISGALYFGVFVNGDVGSPRVEVKDSSFTNIGDVPLNGNQRGVAIYYRAYLTGHATGEISGNRISSYQKGGIVANGVGTRVTVEGNTVRGQGPVNWIAQNGIQIGYGARASVTNNRVSGNAYTGSSTVSGGIIVVGGPGYGLCPGGAPCALTVGTKIEGNVVEDNDIGIFLSNLLTIYGAPPPTPTDVKVEGNTISSRALTNRYAGVGYQAGIADTGRGDTLKGNRISGVGYDAASNPSAYAYDIDASATDWSPGVKVEGNRCSPDPSCNGWNKASPSSKDDNGDKEKQGPRKVEHDRQAGRHDD